MSENTSYNDKSKSTIPATTPEVHCRCCGREMDAYIQPALGPNKPAQPYVTCWNQRCAMYGQTLNAADYPTLDLAKYGATDDCSKSEVR